MFASCVVMALAGSFVAAAPDVDRVRKCLKSDEYAVTWGAAPTFDPGASLEIGLGDGHGSTLRWLRLQPTRDRVDILSIHFDEGYHPYDSKWPPDRTPVTVQSARMTPRAYAALLGDLAVVEAAKILPVQGKLSLTMSSRDFWVQVRLASGGKTLVDSDWAGYEGSLHEPEYAKPQAGVDLTRAAIKRLAFKNHSLTAEERGWASTKFARDWSRMKGRSDCWWVRERSIVTVGVAGDATALPALREALGRDPKDHCVYHAINAIVRLTGKDVRDKPVEEMDIERTRAKVLDVLRDLKK